MSKKAYIKALANYIPEKVVTNYDFEKTLDTSHEWIVTRTGIETRYISRSDEGAYEMAMGAINNLKLQGMDLSEVDAIIVPTTTKEYLFPSTASLIQNALGLKNCFTLDLSAACSGYIYSLNTAASLIESGMYKNILVIASEKITKDPNPQDRGTVILFGDSASVALISAREDDGRGIIGMHMKSEVREDIISLKASGSAFPITAERMDNHEHQIFMEGSEVFKIAVTEFANSMNEVLEKAGVSLDQVALFVPHQANLRIIQYVAKKANFPMEKVSLIIQKYGNTSASSIGLGLTEAYHEGRIKKDDYVLLTAFGAGLTWGSTLMKWA